MELNFFPYIRRTDPINVKGFNTYLDFCQFWDLGNLQLTGTEAETLSQIKFLKLVRVEKINHWHPKHNPWASAQQAAC